MPTYNFCIQIKMSNNKYELKQIFSYSFKLIIQICKPIPVEIPRLGNIHTSQILEFSSTKTSDIIKQCMKLRMTVRNPCHNSSWFMGSLDSNTIYAQTSISFASLIFLTCQQEICSETASESIWVRHFLVSWPQHSISIVGINETLKTSSVHQTKSLLITSLLVSVSIPMARYNARATSVEGMWNVKLFSSPLITPPSCPNPAGAPEPTVDNNLLYQCYPEGTRILFSGNWEQNKFTWASDCQW